MRKAVVIKLVWKAGIGGGKDYYVVDKIVNSVEFRPGHSMDKLEVEKLITRKDTRVEIA